VQAKFINEKFIDDSDPIKDMGIGKTINFGEIAKQTIQKGDYGMWGMFLNSLLNKKLEGIFYDSDIKHKSVSTILVLDYNSYFLGTDIRITTAGVFGDEKQYYYYIVTSENYYLYV